MVMWICVGQSMNMGSDFDVFVYIINNIVEEYVCCFLFCVCIVSYNGILGFECGIKYLFNFNLEFFFEKSVFFCIFYEKYCDCFMEFNFIKVWVFFVELVINSYLLVERDFYLENLEIKIWIFGEFKQKCKLVVEVFLQNLFFVVLEGCIFIVEGVGLIEEQKMVEILDFVEVGEEVKVRMDLLLFYMGFYKLVVNFESDKLKVVKGFWNVIIGFV